MEKKELGYFSVLFYITLLSKTKIFLITLNDIRVARSVVQSENAALKVFSNSEGRSSLKLSTASFTILSRTDDGASSRVAAFRKASYMIKKQKFSCVMQNFTHCIYVRMLLY